MGSMLGAYDGGKAGHDWCMCVVWAYVEGKGKGCKEGSGSAPEVVVLCDWLVVECVSRML